MSGLIPAGLFESLGNLYRGNHSFRDYWEAEEATLRIALPAIADRISYNYEITRPLAVGGGGVVLLVKDRNLDTERALKVSRPSPGKQRLLARVLQSETTSLLRLAHHNLIRIFAQGGVTHQGQDFPFYVMEYVPGVLDSDKYMAQPERTASDVHRVLDGVLAAVEYLHACGTIHMDLKPGNVLVTPAGDPILSDLGFAKHLRVEGGYTLIGGTEGYMHPRARKLVTEAQSDPNRLTGDAARGELKPAWDLFSLGKTFLELLGEVEKGNQKTLNAYEKRYLRLLACRLLDGHNNEDERAVGLSLSALREIKYSSASQARLDVAKLTGSYNIESRVPELDPHVQDTIQVSVLATTPFTDRVRDLLSDPVFMRLGSFTQLGLLNLIYPTATHTRLEHSLGTFSVLCRMLAALYNDPLNPLFRQIMTEEDLRAGMLAALLHDIGQYPLAHDLEEADRITFSHERIGKEILEDESLTLGKLIANRDGWNVSVDRVASVLEASPKELKGTLKDRVLHSLISGPIDADKLDYLMRDAISLGLPYGKIDFERLCRCLTIIHRAEGEQTYAALGIHEKGKVPAESVSFSRYAMFGTVYWHHAYRAIKAMLHMMVWTMLESAKDKRAELRDAFRRFVMPKAVAGVQQLFAGGAADLGGTRIRDVCQVQQGDLAVLEWIVERSGGVGQEFVALLRKRKLFKRILVLSREKAADGRLWDRASAFYKSEDALAWQRKLLLQRNFQRRIGELVDSPPEPPAVSAVVTADARNGFLAGGQRETLVLVDLPKQSRRPERSVEYLVEEDRRRFKVDEIRTESLEESVVWKTLQEHLHSSIGKLRVFCHPQHHEFLGAYLSRETLADALGHALTMTETGQEVGGPFARLGKEEE